MKAPAGAELRRRRATILCIGGLDPSAGAGLLADRRAASAAGSVALTVLSTMTVQSSARVLAVRPVPRGFVRAQIDALSAEVRFGAVKTGLVTSVSAVEEIAAWYDERRGGPLVVDPVLTSGDGTPLAPRAVRTALVRRIFPRAALVTPNRMEAEALTGIMIEGRRGMDAAARAIAALGPGAVLIKGGHLDGAPVDVLWEGRTVHVVKGGPRRRGRWHGLGCHLASAIAARLALGEGLVDAVASARAILAAGMRRPHRTPSGRLVPCWDRFESTG